MKIEEGTRGFTPLKLVFESQEEIDNLIEALHEGAETLLKNRFHPATSTWIEALHHLSSLLRFRGEI